MDFSSIYISGFTHVISGDDVDYEVFGGNQRVKFYTQYDEPHYVPLGTTKIILEPDYYLTDQWWPLAESFSSLIFYPDYKPEVTVKWSSDMKVRFEFEWDPLAIILMRNVGVTAIKLEPRAHYHRDHLNVRWAQPDSDEYFY